ncbi:General negative regulator of transcription subunit 4 [Quillaja saponaria]|uniref:General negative regulator of transcription subunit 4 n=1 Tax=Quillaja saponaria TaxID=32244 RepID=A0AAD7LDU0_QUISA|nr:General negative regulator of transcription subunit 4 [Quillaja saponaria]
MVSDSFTTPSIPSTPKTKNLGKKKRTNRSAKLKQCKFDARREQWLSQGGVKNKGCNDGRDDVHTSPMHMRKGLSGSLDKLEMRTGGKENDGSIHQDSDLEYLSNSPTSFNKEEEGDDGILDDWEAMADALAADDKNQNPCLDSPPVHEPVVQLVCPTNGLGLGVDNSKPETDRLVPRAPENTRAWRPDDAFRPQSLPNLSKQQSLPNPDRHYGGGIPWACTAVMAVPSSCPICYEDLDLTDTSFLPCFCGFRLCLFCHKRILEEDGRCPGCRKPYEHDPVQTEASVHGGSLTFRLARSCSMIESSRWYRTMV